MANMIVQSLRDEEFVSDKTSCKCKQEQPCANAWTGVQKHQRCDEGQISTNLFEQVLVEVWLNSLDKATRQRVFAGEGGYAASHGRRTVVNRLRPKVGTGHGILANLPGQLCVV